MAKKNSKTAGKKKMPKKGGKKDIFISKAPIRRLMKEEGANLVSDEALDLLIGQLEKIGTATTKKAMKLVKDEDRKRLTAEDIANATQGY
jgi:histone H3/H4